MGTPEMVKETQTAKNGVWIPERYATGDDDQLMRSLIEEGLAYTKDKDFDPKYELKTIEGCGATKEACLCCMQKHTHYWVDEAGALAAGNEIVSTNLHLAGEKLTSFMGNNFPEMWTKYDVLKTGWIEVDRMALFYKDLMGDATIAI